MAMTSSIVPLGLLMFVLHGAGALDQQRDASPLSITVEAESLDWSWLAFSDDDDDYVTGSTIAKSEGKKGKGTSSKQGKKGGKGDKDGKGGHGEKNGGKGGKGQNDGKGGQGKGGKKGGGKGEDKGGHKNPSRAPAIVSPHSDAPLSSASPLCSLTPTATPHPTSSHSPTGTQTTTTLPTATHAPSRRQSRSSSPNRSHGSNDHPSSSPTQIPASEDRPSQAPVVSKIPTRQGSNDPVFISGPTVSPDPTLSPSTSNVPSSIPGPTVFSSNAPSDQSSASGRKDLSPYGIAYTVTSPDVPGAIDYAEVALLTNNYLRTYFEDIFGETQFTTLDNFITVFVSGNFVFNEPVHVDYESTAYFNTNVSESIPHVPDLDVMLRQAFKGENLDEYLAQLSTLTSNVFSGTTKAKVVNSTSTKLSDQERQQEQNAILGSNQSGGASVSVPTIVAVSSGAMAVGALMLFLTRRRKRRTSKARFTKSTDDPVASALSEYDYATTDDMSWSDSRTTALSPFGGVYLSEVSGCISEYDENDPQSFGSHLRQERSPLFGDRSVPAIDDDSFSEVHL